MQYLCGLHIVFYLFAVFMRVVHSVLSLFNNYELKNAVFMRVVESISSLKLFSIIYRIYFVFGTIFDIMQK